MTQNLPSISRGLAVGFLAFALCTPASATDHPAGGTPRRSIDGKWTAKPLLRLGDALPGTGGTLQEVAEAYWVESGTLVLRGRFGEVIKTKFRIKENPWALYSVGADGVVRTVLRSGVPFAQAGGKDMIVRFYGPADRDATAPDIFPSFAGARMLYWSARTTLVGNYDHVFGWDGEKTVRVVGRGDKLTTASGEEVVIDDVWVTSTTSDGRALLTFNSSKPRRRTEGHALYDGTVMTDCWLEKEPVPEIVRDDTAQSTRWRALVKNIRQLPGHKGYGRFEIDGVVPLGQDARRALLSISLIKSELAAGGNWYDTMRLPSLFSYDGEQLLPVAFAPSGPDLVEVSTAYGRRGLSALPVPVRIRAVPGLGSAVAEFHGLGIKTYLADTDLPRRMMIAALASSPRIQHFSADSGRAGLENPPLFAVEGSLGFSVADIVGWRDADHVVVRSPTGFFELSRL